MQRIELQFYAFFMTVLSGSGLGLLFDLLRALRGFLKPNRFVAALGDLIFWVGATLLMASGLFLGNWGEFRLYVLVGMLLGVGLYNWMASPVVLAIVSGLLRLIAWLLDLLVGLLQRLLWAPLVALVLLLVGVGRVVLGWLGRLLGRLLGGLWRSIGLLGGWLMRPLIRPWRLLRLQVLLIRRGIRRWRRRLIGGRPRRRD